MSTDTTISVPESERAQGRAILRLVSDNYSGRSCCLNAICCRRDNWSIPLMSSDSVVTLFLLGLTAYRRQTAAKTVS